MRRLTQGGDYTPEELHYRYDERGRLIASAFAQTPYKNAQGQDYETNGAAPYYPTAFGTGTSNMASSRCVARYVRDAAGRVLTQDHWWEKRNSVGAMTPELITGETDTYATSGAWKGLKTGVLLSVRERNAGVSAVHTRSDAYEYDVDRGYLTKWTPSDQTYANRTWSYDAAGNRGGGTYDALNRMSAFGSAIGYGLDAAGNRTSRQSSAGTTAYTWDPLNRMSGVSGPLSTSYGSTYHYRADGLRAAQLRAASGTNTRITAYRYDGQMPVEEAFSFGSTVETTRFAVGPRGTERQALTTSSGTDVSYPLYDAHGNAFASIRRDTNNPGGYVPLTASDVRAFDPWGNGITSTGSSTGFGMPESGRPVQAYVGSLGHRKDDETGLIYMRARYYDPQVGRFTSEDPARDGVNWFVYCSNNPVNEVDAGGKTSEEIFNLLMKAYRLFMDTNWGYAASTATKELEDLVGELAYMSNMEYWQARALMISAVSDDDYRIYLFSAYQMQKKISEIGDNIRSSRLLTV